MKKLYVQKIGKNTYACYYLTTEGDLCLLTPVNLNEYHYSKNHKELEKESSMKVVEINSCSVFAIITEQKNLSKWFETNLSKFDLPKGEYVVYLLEGFQPSKIANFTLKNTPIPVNTLVNIVSDGVNYINFDNVVFKVVSFKTYEFALTEYSIIDKDNYKISGITEDFLKIMSI